MRFQKIGDQPGEAEDAGQNAREQHQQEACIGGFPGLGEAPPQQRADRVGHCADGAQQLIVDTGDERHGTAGDTGHHIRSTHRHAFGVQQKSVFHASFR